MFARSATDPLPSATAFACVTELPAPIAVPLIALLAVASEPTTAPPPSATAPPPLAAAPLPIAIE
ncbi:hypothetical protein C6Q15_15535 [Burkholderia multivorans]|uniref:Uncharacterized protein n=1 Tax=Burkholderia multivorans TaxID=87883 RepID=A0A2S9MNJ7_9BURK|nr:hypothetical protein C6Q07_01480 [Burkholderia multivorans]PRF60342.1 hypothetical protein C6Q15_15535 [Burkholderia multivorans]